MAKIDVLLFAVARDISGRDTITIEVGLPAPAHELMAAIGVACPPLEPLLASCRLAVDQSYVSGNYVVTSGVEVALIPPVSGG